MKAILTIGVSASGKTTWAEQFVKENEGWVNINRDDIRFNLLGVRDWSKWNWKREVEVSGLQEKLIKEAVDDGKNIIISDTNLNPKFRKTLTDKLIGFGYEVEVKEFEISFEEAVKRDTKRANGVGYSVIAKQHEQWLSYLEEQGYSARVKHVEGLPNCVIVDVDGTLAHMNNRSPFDWDKVGGDSVDEVVKDIVNSLFHKYTIIILSGRDSVCKDETFKWLEENIVFDKLYMRAEGDMRKDTIVKRELFDEHIRGKYNVAIVLDDRPSVCRMWADLGLKVARLGNPYIEF